MILVSSRLSPTERKSVAMHEFVEWSQKRSDPMSIESHCEAVRKQDPRLLKSVTKKSQEYRPDQRSCLNPGKDYVSYDESLARAIAEKKKQQSLVHKLFKKLFG